MSIFDSIMGDVSSFGDALSAVTSAAGVGKDTKSSSDSYYQMATQNAREDRMLSLLRSGQMQNPYMTGREFTAAKTKPAEQTDSETVNQQWLQRLNKYSSVSGTMFPGAKAGK